MEEVIKDVVNVNRIYDYKERCVKDMIGKQGDMEKHFIVIRQQGVIMDIRDTLQQTILMNIFQHMI